MKTVGGVRTVNFIKSRLRSYSIYGVPYDNAVGLHPDLIKRYSESDCAILASTLALRNGWSVSAILLADLPDCDAKFHDWQCGCPFPRSGQIVHAWARTPDRLLVDVLGVEALHSVEEASRKLAWAPKAVFRNYASFEEFESAFFIEALFGDPLPDGFCEYPELDLVEEVADFISEKLARGEWPPRGVISGTER